MMYDMIYDIYDMIHDIWIDKVWYDIWYDMIYFVPSPPYCYLKPKTLIPTVCEKCILPSWWILNS